MAKRLSGGLAGVLLLALAGAAGPAAQEPADKPDKEAEAIERVVNALLAAYRSNDYDAMARYYAPEVVMVSTRYEPPLVGWALIRQAYQARTTGFIEVELNPEDMHIERRGQLAWVYYRWSFVGRAREQYLTTLGHSTLVLEKRGRDWLVVHNHSSAIPTTPPQSRPAQPQPQR